MNRDVIDRLEASRWRLREIEHGNRPRCGGSGEIAFNNGPTYVNGGGIPDPQCEDSAPCLGCPDCEDRA